MDVHKRHGTGDSNVELLTKKKHAAKVEYFCTFGRRTFPFLGEKSFTISEVFRSDSGADNRKRVLVGKVGDKELVEHWF